MEHIVYALQTIYSVFLYIFQSCGLYLVFYVLGTVHRNSMSINVKQDVTIRSLYDLLADLDVSGGVYTHHQEHK